MSVSEGVVDSSDDPFRCFKKVQQMVLDGDITDAQTLPLRDCLGYCLASGTLPMCNTVMYFKLVSLGLF